MDEGAIGTRDAPEHRLPETNICDALRGVGDLRNDAGMGEAVSECPFLGREEGLVKPFENRHCGIEKISKQQRGRERNR